MVRPGSFVILVELYYLIYRFLFEGPCKEAAKALEHELRTHRQLLPLTYTYDGAQEPMTLERLAEDYPNVKGAYLPELFKHLLNHIKERGDPHSRRVRSLRHGDDSLLTMLTAFQRQIHPMSSRTFYSMSKRELGQLSFHEALLARDVGADVLSSTKTPAFLSSFYRERVTLCGHRQHVFCLAFDKTDRRLFTGSDDCLVKVWDTKTGYLIHSIRGHQNMITDIAVNEENTLVATASADGYVRVWSMDGFAPVANLKAYTTAVKPLTSVKFSPSPKSETRYLLATSEDGLVRLWKWDRETLQFFDIESPVAFSCKFKATDRLRCSSFNSVGTRFTVAGDDGFVYIFSTIKWDKNDKTSRRNDESSEQFDGPRGGRGRRRVASALFPDKNGQQPSQPVVPIAHLEGHMGSVTDLAFSHDGKRILSGCQDGTARIWSYDKKKDTWNSIVLDVQKEEVDVVVVVPKQDLNDTTTKMPSYDPPTSLKDPSEIGTLIPPPSAEISPPENDSNIPDGSSSNETPTASNTFNNDESQPTDTSPKVSMIAWSADDRLCIIATTEGDIKVYHSYSGRLSCILKGHEGETYAVESHPSDPYTVLSAGYDGNVILWDLRRKQVISHQHYPGRVFLECKFTDDGMQYALSDDDGACTLFRIGGLDRDCEQANSWQRGQYFYTDYVALRFAPDGSFVDEQTLQPPHLMPPSPIIDWRGVEYPKQKQLGYGRNLPITYKGFATKDARRLECYELEEDELRDSKPIVPHALDRASVARRRREFVKSDEDVGADNAVAEPLVQWTTPVAPFLLPDDSDDEDYHEEARSGGDSSSEQSASEADPSEAPYAGGGGSDNEQQDTDRPVTRSRAGQMRPSSGTEMVSDTRSRSQRSSQRGRGRGRGRRPNRAANVATPSRATPTATILTTSTSRPSRVTRSSRRRYGSERSDDEDEMPVQPRRRLRGARVSYTESDLEDSEPEFSEESKDSDTDQDFVGTRTTHRREQTASERKGKRRLRSSTTGNNSDGAQPESSKHAVKRRLRSSTVESDEDFVELEASNRTVKRRAVGREKPESSHTEKSPGPRRPPEPRNLTRAEIRQHAPREWIKTTERSLSKYLPQVGDRVALLTEGLAQYWKVSKLTSLFDKNHGPFKCDEPVLFGTVMSCNWQVGPPTFCTLTLRIQDLTNIRDAMLYHKEPIWDPRSREVIIDYADEDGCPEFIVLHERFMASMTVFHTLRPGKKVDAMYGDARYTGKIASVKKNGLYWKRARSASPWACYHVIWDDEDSQPDDLSPWEVVPSGEDFEKQYNVGARLPSDVTRRACNIIKWMSAREEFELYVSPVDFYEYPTYLSQIAYPICLDMVRERLENGFYRQKEAVIDDIELVRKNAQLYNDESSAASRDAVRMANFFKSRLDNMQMPLSLGGRGSGKRAQTRARADESDYEEEGSQRQDVGNHKRVRTRARARAEESEYEEEDSEHQDGALDSGNTSESSEFIADDDD